VNTLKKKGIDIISVTEYSLGLSDREVLDLANRKERIVVTFDKDFGELIFREKLKTKGLVLLRFIPKSPKHIAKRIEYLLTAEILIKNCILIVKEDSVRVAPLK
jgi:predicted nuclease of predicted toxin-antitoxin system